MIRILAGLFIIFTAGLHVETSPVLAMLVGLLGSALIASGLLASWRWLP